VSQPFSLPQPTTRISTSGRTLGLLGLWILVTAGLLSWWLLMVTLFQDGSYLAALVTAYAMPTLYTLGAFLVPRQSDSLVKPLHFLFLLVATVTHALLWMWLGAPLPHNGAGAYLGLGLIATVLTLMQYPVAGMASYSDYRKPVFFAGVIFKALFVYLAALLPNVPPPPALAKTYLLPLGFLGFWLSAAWLALRACHGAHVPGLEVRPLTPFRPDYILPGGVMLIKGTVLMGVGLMIAIHPTLGMPKWNWWGFVLAFFGIVTLIPLRATYKMARGRRLRLLGLNGSGPAHALAKEGMLFIGLLILLYGFVNDFFGTVPFTALGFEAQYNAFTAGTSAERAVSSASFALAFVLLVPVRGWYKTRLLEGVETVGQRFLVQLLLWLGVLLLFVGFIHLFNLPPIREAGYLTVYPQRNPLGFAIGLALFLAGTLLILVFRPITMRHELEATMKTMVGLAADQAEAVRYWMIERRVRTLAAMLEAQRYRHVAWMIAGLGQLSPEAREKLMVTQNQVLAGLDSKDALRMMAAMDHAMTGGA
jgi:hypothetical protein